jgi:hypothetical protein
MPIHSSTTWRFFMSASKPFTFTFRDLVQRLGDLLADLPICYGGV